MALQWASITALPAVGPLSCCPLQHNPTPHAAPLCTAAGSAAPQQTASAAAICLQRRGCRVASGEKIKKMNPDLILISSEMSHACSQPYMFYVHIHAVYYITMDVFSCTPSRLSTDRPRSNNSLDSVISCFSSHFPPHRLPACSSIDAWLFWEATAE